MDQVLDFPECMEHFICSCILISSNAIGAQ